MPTYLYDKSRNKYDKNMSLKFMRPAEGALRIRDSQDSQR
jgi:hypothetical protein